MHEFEPTKKALREFIGKVNSQLGKALTTTQADALISAARMISTSIPRENDLPNPGDENKEH